MCSPCNAKRKTLKRCVFHRLPNVLVLHLKRFEWTFGEDLRTEKVNDYYEFPEELNLYPYTTENLNPSIRESSMLSKSQFGDNSTNVIFPPSYYQYRLAGVVIHQGSADGGHYFSLIRDKSSKKKPSESRWFEFNDSTVKPFDYSKLGDYSYGGTYEVYVKDKDGTRRKEKRPKSTNAYILVYEREEFLDPESGAPLLTSVLPLKQDPKTAEEKKEGEKEKGEGNSEQSSSQQELSARTSLPEIILEEEKKEEDKKEERGLLIHWNEAKTIAPPDILYEILEENSSFLKERNTFNDQFFSFIWDYLNLHTRPSPEKSPEKDLSLLTVEFSLFFFLEILGRAKHTHLGSIWKQHILRLFLHNPHACRWLLNCLMYKKGFFHNIFYRISKTSVQDDFCDIMGVVFQTLSKLESPRYPTPTLTLNDLHEKAEKEKAEKEVKEKEGDKGKEEKKEGTVQGEKKEGTIEGGKKEEDEIIDEKKLYNITFIDKLLQMLLQIHRKGSDPTHIFLILYKFASAGHAERQYLMQLQVLEHLFDFFNSRNVFSRSKGYSLVNSVSAFLSKLGNLVGVVSLLLRHSVCIQWIEKKQEEDPKNDKKPKKPKKDKKHAKHGHEQPLQNPYQLGDKDHLFTISPETAQNLLGRYFLESALEDDIGVSHLVPLFKFLSFENEPNTRYLSSLLNTKLKEASLGQIDSCLRCAKAFMSVEDSLQVERVTNTCTRILLIMKAVKGKAALKLKRLAQFFFETGRKNLKVKAFVEKHSGEIDECLEEEGPSGNGASKFSFSSIFYSKRTLF